MTSRHSAPKTATRWKRTLGVGIAIVTTVIGTVSVASASASAATAVNVTVTGAKLYGNSTIAFSGTAANGATLTGTITCTKLASGASIVDPTIPVGTYFINGSTCSGASFSDPSYTVGTYSGQFTVYKAPLTVTANNVSKVYNSANPALTYTISGFANGETTSVVTGSPTLSSTATTSSDVGSYPISVNTGTLKATNYYFVGANGSLSVTPYPLTATVTGSNTYGGSPTFAAASSVARAPITGVTCTTVNGGTAISPTLPFGGYTIDGSSCSGGTSANPDFAVTAYTGSTYSVAKALLNVTADNLSRPYGAANPPLTYTVTGFQNGDTSSILAGSPALSTSATPTSDVGDYTIAVTPGNLRANTNYAFSYHNGSLAVTAAPVTVTVTGAQNYGAGGVFVGNTHVSGLGATGITCTTVNGGTPIDATLPAGSYTIDGSSCSGATLSSSNYSLAGYAGGTYTVYKAMLTVTADNQTKTYGAANPPLTYTVTGFQNGDTASVLSGAPLLSTTATTASNVGNYPISIAVNSLRAANYYVVTAPGTLSITPAPVTVNVTGAQYYGSSVMGFAGTTGVSGLTVSGISCTTVNGGTAISPTLNAGTYELDAPSCSGGALSSGNYSIAGYTAGTYQVAKSPLTVTPNNASRNYGAANPAFTYTIAGFVNGDDASVVTGAPNLTSAANSTSPTGTYPITGNVGTLKAANYYFTVGTGTMTVNQAPVTVTVTGAQNYGSTPGFAGRTPVSGLTVSGVTCSSVNGGTSITPALNAGTYTIDGANCSGGTLSNPNYTIAGYTGGALTVFRVQLKVVADNQSQTYGSAVPTLTYSYTGFVNGDTAATALTGTPALSTTASASSPVGTYPITIGQGTLHATNYYFTAVSGTDTVTPATLTVTANDANRDYGLANPALTYTITGFVNGDTASVVSGTPTESTTATSSSDAGTYPITIGAGTLSATNYVFTFANGTLTVNKATPAITGSTALLRPISATLTYGASKTPLTGVPVVFTVNKLGTALCTSTTDANGKATCVVPANQNLNVTSYGYIASFAGNTDFNPVSVTVK